MRNLSLCPLLFLSLLPLSAAEYLSYDPDRRVPFLSDAAYARCDYHWFIHNTGQPSDLYLNGVWQSSENGTNDVRLAEAWAFQSAGASVGVVDINNAHGQRVLDVASATSQTPANLSGSIRLFPEDVAVAISNFVAAGKRVIVVTTGANNVAVSNACRFAEMSNVMVVCSVPNSGVNIDVSPDYPASWASLLTAIVPVTSTDRNGNLYGPNAAWGTNTIGGPGRNIVANGTYSSGTSYAAPIVAGCLSLLVERFPHQTSAAYRQALMESSHVLPLTRRIDAVALLLAPQPHLSINISNLTVHGLSQWRYDVEGSWDLQNWGYVATVNGGDSLPAQEGLFRVRVSRQPVISPPFSEMPKSVVPDPRGYPCTNNCPPPFPQ